ncbi:MAG: hypothetical protein ACKVH0_18720 [Alphaproteobacteria bacterium]
MRARVQFIQPASFVDCDPGRTFDVVSLCNGLMYVQAPGQAQAIDRISGYNSALLAVTGGHPDTIATDLTRNGYAPILSGLHDIHNGWTDRIRPPSWPKGAPLPHNIHCDPFLDAIDDQPGWQYRFGALFQKEPAA